MAEWVSHLIVADRVLKKLPGLRLTQQENKTT